ncbi:MAG: hypothetical protein ACXVDA_21795 [Ktedonobacterales bacterium]
MKDGPYRRPEGPGLKAITEGILALYPADAARLNAGAAVFDALYAYCQESVRRASGA